MKNSSIQEIIQKNIKVLLQFIDENAKVILLDKSKDDQNQVFWVKIESKEPAILIGQKGSNLRALQHLVSVISRRKIQEKSRIIRIILDVNDYRLNRLEFLKRVAIMNYKKAVQTKHLVVLKPMTAYDRRVIHLTLAPKEEVKTESLGEEPNRRVVIRPKKKNT